MGLPATLISLSLDFRCNASFTDDGLSALAQWLPVALRSLSLDFECNERFTDHGFAALEQHLPARLWSLSLDFWRNRWRRRSVTNSSCSSYGPSSRSSRSS